MGAIVDKKKILIIEDDQDFVRLLTMSLRASHYDVTVASDAIQAVSQARRICPDLIILDIGLPAGNGFLVMERLKGIQVLPTTPVVVVSAHDPATHKDRALKAGASAFFQKPADNDELMAGIRQALGEE
jgi:DNA-binding response OmpR family regulator